MVTFVLKRLVSDSIVRVQASEKIQALQKSLEAMIAIHCKILALGGDTMIDGIDASERIESCKDKFTTNLVLNLHNTIEDMGEGWVLEDLELTDQ